MSKTLYTQDKHGNYHLKEIVEIDYTNYWSTVGRSTFNEQKYNVNGMRFEGRTKVESVLQYAKGKRLLEIGACPGELLKEATNRGFEAVGIATETPWIDQLRSETGCEIIEGYFPDVKIKGKFDTIIAMDVFEHVEDSEAFLNGCRKLLNKDGVIIFMLPLICDDLELPEQHYMPEHIHLFTKDYITKWLNVKTFDRWTAGHEIIVF